METKDPVKIVLIFLVVVLVVPSGFLTKKNVDLRELARKLEKEKTEYQEQRSLLEAENTKLKSFADSLITRIEKEKIRIEEIHNETDANIARVDSMSYSEKRSYFAERYGLCLSADGCD